MKTKKKIKDTILALCMGKDIDECEEILKKNFNDVSFCDEKIDEGLDDDVYLMMRSYDVDNVYVRFYYGDDDNIVTDISFSN